MVKIDVIEVARPGAGDSSYYSVPAINGMVAALTAAANMRKTVAPVRTDDRISALTHGFGGRSDALSTISFTANQLRGLLVYIGEETTFKEIGIRVETLGVGVAARLGIGDYNFGTKTASNILDAGTVDCSTTGDKSIVINETRQPGWLAILVYASGSFGALGSAAAASGYSMATTGAISCTPVQTGVAYSAFGTTEVFNTNSTSLTAAWLVGA